MPERRGTPPPLLLLLGAAGEATLLTFFFGYISSYVYLVRHQTAELAALAAAVPTVGFFLGSLVWGWSIRRLRLQVVVAIGLLAYLPISLIGLLRLPVASSIAAYGVLALGAAALRPAVAAYLSAEPEGIGWRLGLLFRWQSLGWLVGGFASGYLLTQHLTLLPLYLAVQGLSLGLLGILTWILVPPPPGTPLPTARGLPRGLPLAVWPLLLSFFFVYAGYEGLYATLGLYLHAVHTGLSWIGYSVGLSMLFGSLVAGWVGDASDRYGGERVYVWSVAGYVATYLLMALVGRPSVTLAVFSLPLFSGLQVGVQRRLAELAPRPQLGQAMGAYNGATAIASAVGTLAFGAFDGAFGAAHAPWLAFLLVGAGMAAYGPRLVGSRRPPSASAPPLGEEAGG